MGGCKGDARLASGAHRCHAQAAACPTRPPCKPAGWQVTARPAAPRCPAPMRSEELLKQLAEQMQGLVIPAAKPYYRWAGQQGGAGHARGAGL